MWYIGFANSFWQVFRKTAGMPSALPAEELFSSAHAFSISSSLKLISSSALGSSVTEK
jgi:hypothetical protein